MTDAMLAKYISANWPQEYTFTLKGHAENLVHGLVSLLIRDLPKEHDTLSWTKTSDGNITALTAVRTPSSHSRAL